ncbi:metallophosphoesterase family protein [Chloroflexota bacterium]
MLIGLLSDTHIPEHARKLPTQIEEVFRNVDMILHGGDIYSVSVLDELEHLAPVWAASGDDDYAETFTDRRVKQKHILTIEGVTIWLMHIPPWALPPGKEDSAPLGHKNELPPDVIVYGHTHHARAKHDNGVLQVNPGSPTCPDYDSKLGTVALLTVSSGKAEVQILQL